MLAIRDLSNVIAWSACDICKRMPAVLWSSEIAVRFRGLALDHESAQMSRRYFRA